MVPVWWCDYKVDCTKNKNVWKLLRAEKAFVDEILIMYDISDETYYWQQMALEPALILFGQRCCCEFREGCESFVNLCVIKKVRWNLF